MIVQNTTHKTHTHTRTRTHTQGAHTRSRIDMYTSIRTARVCVCVCVNIVRQPIVYKEIQNAKGVTKKQLMHVGLTNGIFDSRGG